MKLTTSQIKNLKLYVIKNDLNYTDSMFRSKKIRFKFFSLRITEDNELLIHPYVSVDNFEKDCKKIKEQFDKIMDAISVTDEEVKK